jgi:hypothetical protein
MRRAWFESEALRYEDYRLTRNQISVHSGKLNVHPHRMPHKNF